MNKEDFLNSIYYGSILRFSFNNLEPKKIFLNYSALKLCYSEILHNNMTETLFGYEVQVYNDGKERPEFYLGF